MLRQLLLLILLLPAAAVSARAADWPHWRGRNRNAVSTETGLLKSWDNTLPPLAWSTSGIGEGYSSVVVVDRWLYTTGRVGDEVVSLALDVTTGEEVWRTKIGETSRNVMSTPTVDGDLVFALDPDGDLACLKSSDGAIVWQRSLAEDFDGRLMSSRGYGESPLIDGDKLICTPGGRDAMIVALQRDTGQTLWTCAVPELGEAGGDGAGFSSIVVSKAAGVRQYVQLIGRGLIGVDSETGEFLWGYNDIANERANIPTPLVVGDLVFASNGYNAGSVLLRIERSEVSPGIRATEVYRLGAARFQNHHGGFVLIDGHIYGGHGSNNGLPTCVELKTGKAVWKKRGPGTGSAAVVAADGCLYFRYQDGVMALIEATPEEYRLRGSFEIPGAGGDSWSHPVVSHGRLLLREQDRVFAYTLSASGVQRTPDAAAASLPEELAVLSQSAAAVQPLTIDEQSRQQNPFYRFALPSATSSKALYRVTLSDQNLNAEGALQPEMLNRLSQMTVPLVLNVSGTRIRVDGLKQISALGSLVGLNVEHCRELAEDAFAELAGAKQLRVLLAAGTSFSGRSARAVAELPSLVALDLEVCDSVTDSACVQIGRMQQLRALSLKKTGFEPTKITDDGLSSLSALTRLESLVLSGNLITDDGLLHLQPLDQLRELDLSLLALTEAGLMHLTPLKNLEVLDLLFSEGFAGPVVTDSGMETLTGFESLRRLNLVGSRITDASLDDLAQIQSLQWLSLIDTQVSEEGIRQLEASLPECHIQSAFRVYDR